MAAKVYDLAGVIEQERRKAAPLVLSDGSKVHILPPILWAKELLDASWDDAAKELLGEHFEQYIADGGTVAFLFERIIPDLFGAEVGES